MSENNNNPREGWCVKPTTFEGTILLFCSKGAWVGEIESEEVGGSGWRVDLTG